MRSQSVSLARRSSEPTPRIQRQFRMFTRERFYVSNPSRCLFVTYNKIHSDYRWTLRAWHKYGRTVDASQCINYPSLHSIASNTQVNLKLRWMCGGLTALYKYVFCNVALEQVVLVRSCRQNCLRRFTQLMLYCVIEISLGCYCLGAVS